MDGRQRGRRQIADRGSMREVGVQKQNLKFLELSPFCRAARKGEAFEMCAR